MAGAPMTAFPDSSHAPLRGGAQLRWGVLAPGEIANDWTATVHANTDQKVVAVGSRDVHRAQRFADKCGVARAYAGYDAVLADPEVDAIYVAAPNHEHARLAAAAIDAGKHVLVEKPLAMEESEVFDLQVRGRRAGVLVMEAMWSRFLPRTTVIRRLHRGVARCRLWCEREGSPANARSCLRRDDARRLCGPVR